MKPGHWLAVGSSVAAGVRAADLAAALGRIPECGVQCITSAIDSSSCSGVEDAACICGDQDLYDNAHECVRTGCSVIDGLEVGKIQDEACDRPARSRKGDLFIPLIIGVPSLACPWLRFYSRWTSGHRFALDDYLMMVCGVIFTVFVVVGQILGQYAFAVDTWTLSMSRVTEGLRLFYIAESLYIVCLCLTKVSVLFFYLRIFPNRNFWYATYAAMAFVIVPTIAMFFMQIFQCQPVSFVWEGWASPERDDKCLDLSVLVYIAAALSIAQDLVVLLMPLPLLFRLNMGFRRKAGIMVMFSLGIFFLATSCVRVRYISYLSDSTNPSWEYTDLIIWTGLETAVSVIVACLPSIRVLIARAAPGTEATGLRGPANNGYVKGGEGSATPSSMARELRRPGQQRRSVFGSRLSDGYDDENESQVELGLRLGDKHYGEVQTAIYGGSRGSGRAAGDAGIRVMTTTTTDADFDSLRMAKSGSSSRGNAVHVSGSPSTTRTPSL